MNRGVEPRVGTTLAMRFEWGSALSLLAMRWQRGRRAGGLAHPPWARGALGGVQEPGLPASIGRNPSGPRNRRKAAPHRRRARLRVFGRRCVEEELAHDVSFLTDVLTVRADTAAGARVLSIWSRPISQCVHRLRSTASVARESADVVADGTLLVGVGG